MQVDRNKKCRPNWIYAIPKDGKLKICNSKTWFFKFLPLLNTFAISSSPPSSLVVASRRGEPETGGGNLGSGGQLARRRLAARRARDQRRQPRIQWPACSSSPGKKDRSDVGLRPAAASSIRNGDLGSCARRGWAVSGKKVAAAHSGGKGDGSARGVVGAPRRKSVQE